GLVSGLDTTALIKQLMTAEAAPQTLLKQKSAATQTFLTALQGLNTRVASLAEAATTAAKATSWQAWSATSSSATAATATASGAAQPASLTFSVDQVAKPQVSLTAAVADDKSLVPTVPPAVTIKKADGTLLTVSPTTGSLSDIAKAVNDAADAGVKATVVRVSNGAVPEYRIQFTGTVTGSAGTFSVYAGTSAAVTAGTANRIDGSSVQAAQDASVTLWKGSPQAQTFTQSSNTFTGLMTGVDVTVAKVTAAGDDPVTVTVGRDNAALAKLASGMVGALGVISSEIASRSATTTTTNSDGTTSVTGGIYSGDSAVRSIDQQLLTAMSMPVNGLSPSTAGIMLAKDGTFTFDEAKFTAALAADPAGVQTMVTTIADRVAKSATAISDKYTGTLTLKITGQQGLVKDYGNQIDSWDRRLELRQASLQATYSALEVTLSGLKAQSSWLAGQISSLPSSS
ncbi:MAG TPA: flagellar filament capping protein FliD, partial [Propionicimonas sp.]